MHKQLLNLYAQQKESLFNVTLYRGQLMPSTELIQLQKSVGQFISFNSFLSTSRDQAVAEMYTGGSVRFIIETSVLDQISNTLADVPWWDKPLFERSVEKPMGKPYASISHVSQFNDEEEVLFMAGTIFYLVKMEPLYEGVEAIWTAHLRLATENDHQLTELYRYRVIELSAQTTIIDDLNPLLIEMGYLTTGETEENVDEMEESSGGLPIWLLESALSVFPTTRGQISLGKAQTLKGDHLKAIQTLVKALKGTTDVHRLAEIETNLALVYEKMKDYSTALTHCQQAEQHSDSADNYTLMVRLYMKLENYVAALQIAESKALPQEKDAIKTARLYRLMGKIYEARKQFDIALENYKTSFLLFEKLYPFDPVNNVFHHNSKGGRAMKDISRHLLRSIDRTKKSEEYAVLDRYFLQFNDQREEANRLHSTTMFYSEPY